LSDCRSVLYCKACGGDDASEGYVGRCCRDVETYATCRDALQTEAADGKSLTVKRSVYTPLDEIQLYDDDDDDDDDDFQQDKRRRTLR